MLEAGVGLIEIARTLNLSCAAVITGWTEQPENCPGFALRYARARGKYLSHLAEEIIEISDDARNDYMDRQSASGTVKVIDAEHVNRSRLRIDSRKWLLSKLRPEIYGEHAEVKVDVTSGGLSCADILRQRLERRGNPELPPVQPMNSVNVIDVAAQAATHAIGKRSDASEANAESSSLDAPCAEIALDESASD